MTVNSSVGVRINEVLGFSETRYCSYSAYRIFYRLFFALHG